MLLTIRRSTKSLASTTARGFLRDSRAVKTSGEAEQCMLPGLLGFRFSSAPGSSRTSAKAEYPQRLVIRQGSGIRHRASRGPAHRGKGINDTTRPV